MKTAFFLILIAVFSISAAAQRAPDGFDLSNYGVRIESDKRVMVVLATLEAARTTNSAGEIVPAIRTPLSAKGSEFRELLKSDSIALDESLRQRISRFITQYKKRNPSLSDAEVVAPFISMAYTLSAVPELADPVLTSDLPGKLLDVLDFAPLVREFYRRSSFSGNIAGYLKAYQNTADGQLRTSTKEMVKDLLDYLHTRPQTIYTEKVKIETRKGKSTKTTLQKIEARERERRFIIVPEMLAPADSVNFLNIRDDYYVIIPPDTDISYSDTRRAFLQYVVDPLVLNNAKEIGVVHAGIKQLLDERRKSDPAVTPDVYLSVSRSMVAAIDARQSQYVRINDATARARARIAILKTDAEKAAVSRELEKFKQSLADETALRLSEDYEKGSVLSFYFAEQLKGLEESGFDIASSMREMILSLDASKEGGRLAEFADARKRGLAAREERRKNPGTTIVAENPVTTRLLEIQTFIAAKDYSRANSDLKVLLRNYPNEPRVHYTIGRLASIAAESTTDIAQQKERLLEAKASYENVLTSSSARTDPALLSLSYVALAKIYEFYDQREYAIKILDAAIKLGDVNGGALQEAVAAKQRLIKEQ
ncbi:MAG: hypothetical protein WBD22_00420 [Pyrinomonadaceae bacterium]